MNCLPSSMTSVWPVMKDDRSEARKSTPGNTLDLGIALPGGSVGVAVLRIRDVIPAGLGQGGETVGIGDVQSPGMRQKTPSAQCSM